MMYLGYKWQNLGDVTTEYGKRFQIAAVCAWEKESLCSSEVVGVMRKCVYLVN